MSRAPLAAFLSALILAIAGCGGDEGSTSNAAASKPESLLVSSGDLPEGTGTGQEPPELCGPLPILEKDGGETAISKTFLIGEVRVVEAVGVFGGPAKAEAAFEDLNERKRIECIGGAIRSFGGGSSIEIIRPDPLDIGDEGSVVRYVALDEESHAQGYSDVVAVRVGRCTVALLIAVESAEPPDAVSEETTKTVADRLDGACG